MNKENNNVGKNKSKSTDDIGNTRNDDAVADNTRSTDNTNSSPTMEQQIEGIEVEDVDVEKKTEKEEIQFLKTELENKTKQCNEYFDMLQRTAAEFDNYKKRTAKEKEALYAEAVSDVIAEFIPVVDNLERALQSSNESENKTIREGIEMVLRQVKETLKKFGVEEIKSVGEKFDPNLHNAVMHIEDDSYGESIIVEEFQKGYTIKDRVIRYSMVKVAN